LDPKVYPVSIDETRLRNLLYTKDEKQITAIDFVADAWRDLVEAVEIMALAGQISQDSPWSSLKATKGFQSVNDKYHDYMVDEFYPLLTEVFAGDIKQKRKIKDIQGFFGVAGEFIEPLAALGPVTISGYLESNDSNPLTSGLIIEYTTDKHDKDFKKGDSFVYDASFNLFASTAAQYGFMIDRNAPWRLVANINSPAMWEYMRGINVSREESANRPLRDDCGDLLPAYPLSHSEASGRSVVVPTIRRHAPGYPEFGNRSLHPTSGAALTVTAEDHKHVLFRSGQYYNNTLFRDMDVLKLYLLDFYQIYARENGIMVDYSILDLREISQRARCGTVGNIVLVRPQVGEEVFNSETGRFGLKWMIRSCYHVRRLELNTVATSQSVKRDLRKLYNVYHGHGGGQAGYRAAMYVMRDSLLPPSHVEQVRTPNLFDEQTFNTSRTARRLGDV